MRKLLRLLAIVTLAPFFWLVAIFGGFFVLWMMLATGRRFTDARDEAVDFFLFAFFFWQQNL